MPNPYMQGSESISQAEHISPDKTGDNIQAKRVAQYGFGSSDTWGRVPLPLVNVPYDYVGMSNADGNGNYQTFTYKKNGSSGTTVCTLTFTYDVNNNVTSITRT